MILHHTLLSRISATVVSDALKSSSCAMKTDARHCSRSLAIQLSTMIDRCCCLSAATVDDSQMSELFCHCVTYVGRVHGNGS